MRRERASILLPNEGALRIAASSARISTQQGSALEIYENSGDSEKNLKLIGKVLASGHKSVIEHQTFSVAFDNVSVLAEQFIIEFRLASFTVKSRRYVDFSDAGYVLPEGMNAEVESVYVRRCKALFAAYEKLLALGIPKEDARFVLPYGFRSNFYMTLNARELIWMIVAMLKGRGSAYPELRNLGMQLKDQFESCYPGIIDSELRAAPEEAPERTPDAISAGREVAAEAALLSMPQNPIELLDTALRFSKRFDGFSAENMRALMLDARPRELELLQYSFRIDNISLACITHFTRHRMLSLMLRHELSALSAGNYILPQSIRENAEATAIYLAAFAEQAEAARRAQDLGARATELPYFALAGHTSSILITMNARELLHFSKLRSCSRAQWEIRGVARQLLSLLSTTPSAPIFAGYGPTCAVKGVCPEGRMSCGHPVQIEQGRWIEK